MTSTIYHINQEKVTCHFGQDAQLWLEHQKTGSLFIISDENIQLHYPHLFLNFPHYIIKTGEVHKNQDTVNAILQYLLDLRIDRSVWIIGIGGGVVTDVAGFVSSIYKRGTPLCLMPTSLLGMVDASLGGKNGINAGLRKNMIGTLYQPQQILFDFNLLQTLPITEWKNGMAEVIKHAATLDPGMMELLENNDLISIKNHHQFNEELIRRNVDVKMNVVAQDPADYSQRHVLNFGHTLGHALEQLIGITHGEAVSIGMVFALRLSEIVLGFSSADTHKITALLQRYGLPIKAKATSDDLLALMSNDKKNKDNQITYVLLADMGKPFVYSFHPAQLQEHLIRFLS